MTLGVPTIPPAPKSLNGFDVIESGPRKGFFGALVVMMYRPGAYQPYVVATWAQHMGNEWVWGHYCNNREEANEVFAEKRAPAYA